MNNTHYVTSDNSDFGGTNLFIYGKSKDVKSAVEEISKSRGWVFIKTTKKEMAGYLTDCPLGQAIDVTNESNGYVSWRILLP